MSSAPGYASTPVTGVALLTTGDTSRTAPATAGTIFTPGASGGLCERILVEPVATAVASVISIFLHDGSTYHLLTEIALGAFTAASGTPIYPTVMSAVDYPNMFPIVVPPNWTIRATVHDTQTGVKVIAMGGGL